jgi:hypothetical protein
MPHGNEGIIDITGNSDSSLDGSIYAPDSHVKINGNSQVDDEPDAVVYFGIQIIADTIYVGGTANLEFIYPGSGIPLEGITLEVAK